MAFRKIEEVIESGHQVRGIRALFDSDAECRNVREAADLCSSTLSNSLPFQVFDEDFLDTDGNVVSIFIFVFCCLLSQRKKRKEFPLPYFNSNFLLFLFFKRQLIDWLLTFQVSFFMTYGTGELNFHFTEDSPINLAERVLCEWNIDIFDFLSFDESIEFMAMMGTLRSEAMAGKQLQGTRHTLAMFRHKDVLQLKLRHKKGPIIPFKFGIPLSANFIVPSVQGNDTNLICMFFVFFLRTFIFPHKIKIVLIRNSMPIWSKYRAGKFMFNIIGSIKQSTYRSKKCKANAWIKFLILENLLPASENNFPVFDFWPLTLLLCLQTRSFDSQRIFAYYTFRLENVIRTTVDAEVAFLGHIRDEFVSCFAVGGLPVIETLPTKGALARLYPKIASKASDPIPLYIIGEFINFLWQDSANGSRLFASIIMLHILMCARPSEITSLSLRNMGIENVTLNINGQPQNFDVLTVIHKEYKTAAGLQLKKFTFFDCKKKFQNTKLLISIISHFKLIKAGRQKGAKAFIQISGLKK